MPESAPGYARSLEIFRDLLAELCPECRQKLEVMAISEFGYDPPDVVIRTSNPDAIPGDNVVRKW